MSRPRSARSARACLGGLLLALSARASNQGVTAGAYAASLGAGAACAAERSALGGNPAALMPAGAGGHLHFHRPFGLEDVEVSEAGAWWDLRRAGFALAWRQTEVAGLYLEQIWEYRQSLRLGRLAGGPIDLGASAAWERAAFPGFARHGFREGLGLRWEALPRLRVGAFASGAARALLAGGGHGEAVWQWGMEARSRPSERRAEEGTMPFAPQTLQLDFRKTGDSPWRVLLALSVSPHASLQVTAGLSTPPFQASLGAKLNWSGFEISQAWRYHRHLGGTFLTGTSFSKLRRR